MHKEVIFFSVLKTALLTLVSSVNLDHKEKDFEHLPFDK
jgi:hypothetical protein